MLIKCFFSFVLQVSTFDNQQAQQISFLVSYLRWILSISHFCLYTHAYRFSSYIVLTKLLIQTYRAEERHSRKCITVDQRVELIRMHTHKNRYTYTQQYTRIMEMKLFLPAHILMKLPSERARKALWPKGLFMKTLGKLKGRVVAAPPQCDMQSRQGGREVYNTECERRRQSTGHEQRKKLLPNARLFLPLSLSVAVE